MDQWVWPAYIGVVIGIGLFAVVFVPVLFWQIRRFGSLSAPRLLGAAALSVYAVVLVAYTLLPLPAGDLAVWCAQHGVTGAQLHPFQFVEDIRAGTAGLSITATATSRAVLQVVFNVALFVPLGMLVRRYLGRGVIVATGVSLATSLLIESTQYTGAWGLFPCAYRVADVDDLIMNTVGGFVGALIAPVFLGWMPQTSELANRRLHPRPVTVWRRWAGMLLDALAFVVVGAVLAIGWRMVRLALGDDLPDGDFARLEWALQFAVPWVVVFCLPAFGSGGSWGQRTMWLRPVLPSPLPSPRAPGAPADGLPIPPDIPPGVPPYVRSDSQPDSATDLRPAFARRLARLWVVGGLWGALQAVGGWPGMRLAGFGLAAALLALAAVLAVLFTADRRGLSCLVTGTRIADSRAPAAVSWNPEYRDGDTRRSQNADPRRPGPVDGAGGDGYDDRRHGSAAGGG